MVRNACRRWKQDETTVFSLASLIVIHRRFPWCSPAIPRMVMWCLTLRPSTTALATWKLFGWESWNLHSEMQMTETGPSITLHDHSLIYPEFFRGESGGKILFPQAVGPERLMCGRQIDWLGGAIWRCCFLVCHFGLLLRIDGQCFFPVGWEMPKKIWVDTMGGTLRDTVGTGRGEGMPRKKSETLWFVGRQESIAFTKPHAIYTYRQQLQSSCRYQRHVWVWII